MKAPEIFSAFYIHLIDLYLKRSHLMLKVLDRTTENRKFIISTYISIIELIYSIV